MASPSRYLFALFLLAAAFVALVVVSDNFYWGASQRPGGDYYLFHRTVPAPFGAVLWAVLKPLLLVLPAGAGWAVYQAVRSRSASRGLSRCPRCGYDLTGNVSGVCPECGGGISRGEAIPPGAGDLR